jgi:hypothetical protein
VLFHPRLIFTFLLFCLLVPLTGQRGSRITEASTEYDKQRFPSLTISVDADVEDVYDPWQEFWEERYDIDIDRIDKDRKSIAYRAEQVRMPTLSDKNFDLYSNVDGTERIATVSMSVVFGERDVMTASSYPATNTAARRVLEEFATYFYRTYFDRQMEEVREELNDVRDDAEDAEKDASKARSKIEKYEEKIADLREKIEEMREEASEELQLADEKSARVRELEARLRDMQTRRREYVN